MLIHKDSATQNLVFLMVDSTDHITGKTGLSPSVTLSKNGSTFAAPAGAVTETGNGWYKVAGHATDSNTLGPLALHATASGADPVDMLYHVVACNPQDAAGLGLSRLDAAVSTRSTYAGADTSGVTTLLSRVPDTLSLANINAQADTALADYDAPTKAELDAAFTDIKGATWSSSTDTLEEIAAVAGSGGGSGPSAADIADAVWDEALAGHNTAGSAGAGLAAASSAGDPWATLLPGSYTTGQAGKIIGDHLDAAVSTRSNHNAADVAEVILDDPVNLLVTDASGRVIVGSNDDKTGYELATPPASAADIALEVWSAEVRTLSAFAFLTTAGLADAVWDEALAAHATPGSTGQAMADIADIKTIVQAGEES